jgi:hypothetical protein
MLNAWGIQRLVVIDKLGDYFSSWNFRGRRKLEFSMGDHGDIRKILY